MTTEQLEKLAGLLNKKPMWCDGALYISDKFNQYVLFNPEHNIEQAMRLLTTFDDADISIWGDCATVIIHAEGKASTGYADNTIPGICKAICECVLEAI